MLSIIALLSVTGKGWIMFSSNLFQVKKTSKHFEDDEIIKFVSKWSLKIIALLRIILIYLSALSRFDEYFYVLCLEALYFIIICYLEVVLYANSTVKIKFYIKRFNHEVVLGAQVKSTIR